ncbi:hypothetical protein DV736_g4168, partial [Chaetothyriales sp. CBS 134916]
MPFRPPWKRLPSAHCSSLRPNVRQLPLTLAEPPLAPCSRREFSTSRIQCDWRSLIELPSRRAVRYIQPPNDDELLCLEWPEPPRNILLVKKDLTTETTKALIEFASHVKSTYEETNIVLESTAASEIIRATHFDAFAALDSLSSDSDYDQKIDLVVTFGGDGTILHAASIFAAAAHVPPVLSFSMGTLGFLGEWKFSEYKRAFREVYMSGAPSERQAILENNGSHQNALTGWSSIRGKSLGSTRGAKILMRQRLKVAVFDADGNRLTSKGNAHHDMHAMNEVILHRGKDPHLAIVQVFVGGRFLTEAVADGMIISTPTGSTAYNLSSGGSIVHPLVPSILLTPICARSLSFRPLVLPATTPITLKLSEKNRGREVELSIDGIRRGDGIGVGTEVRISGEEMAVDHGHWQGGIPCVLRKAHGGLDSDDGWVGGLNGLLKFNYPFGEEH